MKTAAKVVVVLVTLVALTASGFAFVYALSAGCNYQRNQWNALHAVIIEATTIPKGYPATDEQKRGARELQSRLFIAAGPRPAC